MKPHEVRVSVVVPAYNVETYVAATIDSLLRQTLPDFEVLVVDDCSTDATASVAETFMANCKDPRIKLIRHEKNQGVSAARNTGIMQARGEYIALLDGDDVAVPTFLAKQVAALDADPALGMVGAYMAIMNDSGRLTGMIWKRPLTADDVSIGLLFRNTIFTSMTVRKSAVPSGMFRPLVMAEDYDFNVRLARNGKVMNLDMPLAQYRIRGNGLTQTRRASMEKCVRDVMRDQLHELGIEPTAHQLDLNRHVGALTMPNSPALLDELEAWLLKLRDANAERQRYPDAAFRRNLADEWFRICKHATPLGLHALRVWRASSLRGYGEPALLEKVKFIVKCLLRHDRPGGDVPSLA